MAKPVPEKSQQVIVPEPLPAPRPDEAESADVWGFSDTHFDINENGHVTIRGTRYDLSGKELTRFLPWVREVLDSDINPRDVHRPGYPTAIPEPQINPRFLAELQKFLTANQIDTDGEIRLRHGHGHTQEEMYSIKYTQLGRIPDLVVYPEAESQVARLVQAAKQHDVSLIPYGGGTNVTEALRCQSQEQRTIVSVDMRRMNRIVWIDETNMMAFIEAGAVGRHIIAALAKHGVTMGHEPDSVEFSTLGGWIATNAAGIRGDPAAKRGKLNADRFVSHRDAMLCQRRYDVAADRSCFNAGHHVRLVDPDDSVHAPHVDRDNRALLLRLTAKSVSDVGAAAVRNQRNIMLLCRLDQACHLRFRLRIHDQVGNPPELRVLDGVHLFLCVAVAVPKADLAIGVDLIGSQKLLQLRQKPRIDLRLGDCRGITRPMNV